MMLTLPLIRFENLNDKKTHQLFDIKSFDFYTTHSECILEYWYAHQLGTLENNNDVFLHII